MTTKTAIRCAKHKRVICLPCMEKAAVAARAEGRREGIVKAADLATYEARRHNNLLVSGEDIDFRYEQGAQAACERVSFRIRALLDAKEKP